LLKKGVMQLVEAWWTGLCALPFDGLRVTALIKHIIDLL
jgi:hypothetical protein